MAYHFSANQFDKQYSAERLNNWELPRYFPKHPRTCKGTTKIIANDNGHIIDEKLKCDPNPWGNFRSTYQLPRKITRKFVEEYDACLTKRGKWKKLAFEEPNVCPDKGPKYDPCKCPTKCETSCRILNEAQALQCRKKPPDLEYRPGDYTPSDQQLNTSSYKDIIQQKLDKERAAYLGDQLKIKNLSIKDPKDDHSCTLNDKEDKPFTPCLPLTTSNNTNNTTAIDDYSLTTTTNNNPPTSLLPKTAALTTSLSPATRDYQFEINNSLDLLNNMPNHAITEKPNERCPSPVIPAYANFELAKRMHHENLDHQPLPDCVADLAFRKQQINGGFPGLALDIAPVSTGVGIKMHNAGPTHCTKMKVYRPKTCGVVPKPFNGDLYRATSATPNKKMGAMDLAICWDYRPENPADEPPRPRHIDGSNESAGPAVFTCVKTPRDDNAAPAQTTGRSAGVFNSTLGEPDFFDKDILRRKTDFGGRKIDFDDPCKCDYPAPSTRPRAQSVTRDSSFDFNPTGGVGMTSRYDKQYQSSPNIAEQPAYKAMRNKYLENTAAAANYEFKTPNRLACKRENTSFLRRARNRLCHKIAPEPPAGRIGVCCRSMPIERAPIMHCKAGAFRAGVPKFNAAGCMISSDSGCSVGHGRVLVVPRPRNPYSKKNYDIDTLVPPFRSLAGGAGEGGYPEHWRLASVYQHAYKPLEQRRRPLLQTVYK